MPHRRQTKPDPRLRRAGSIPVASSNSSLSVRRVLALRMGSFHQGSTARHVAISAFALYALLLEAFLAASAPAPAFAYQGEISGVTCTLDGSGSVFWAEILSSTMDFAAYWLAPPLPAPMSVPRRRSRLSSGAGRLPHPVRARAGAPRAAAAQALFCRVGDWRTSDRARAAGFRGSSRRSSYRRLA